MVQILSEPYQGRNTKIDTNKVQHGVQKTTLLVLWDAGFIQEVRWRSRVSGYTTHLLFDRMNIGAQHGGETLT
jgi:hypothetical protein